MIEVIKLGFIDKYEIICKHCASILRFTNLDIHSELMGYDYYGVPEVQTNIICPCCQNKLILSINGNVVTKYKQIKEKEQNI